jgi:hypothetical protein
MKGEKKLKIRIRRILFPILFCLAVACIIELPLAQTTIFGDDVILWDTLFRSVIAVPMLVHLYREDSVFRGKEHWNGKIAAAAFFSGAGISLAFGLAVRALQISGAALADERLFTGNRRLWCFWRHPRSLRNIFSAAFSMEDARSLYPPRRQHL